MSPRIPPGSLRELGPATWVFSRIAGRAMKTEPPAIFTTLGRGGGLFWGWLHFASRLMPGGKLPRRETELVILRVAHVRGCDYEWSHHVGLARRAGLSRDDIERVRDSANGGGATGEGATGEGAMGDGALAEGWSDHDRILLTAVDGLLRDHDLDDKAFEALRAELDQREIVEFLLLVGHYDMLATTLSALRIEPDAARD